MNKKQWLLEILQGLIDGDRPTDYGMPRWADQQGLCCTIRRLVGDDTLDEALDQFCGWYCPPSVIYPIILGDVRTHAEGRDQYDYHSSLNIMWEDNDYAEARREFIEEFRDWLKEQKV